MTVDIRINRFVPWKQLTKYHTFPIPPNRQHNLLLVQFSFRCSLWWFIRLGSWLFSNDVVVNNSFFITTDNSVSKRIELIACNIQITSINAFFKMHFFQFMWTPNIKYYKELKTLHMTINCWFWNVQHLFNFLQLNDDPIRLWLWFSHHQLHLAGLNVTHLWVKYPQNGIYQTNFDTVRLLRLPHHTRSVRIVSGLPLYLCAGVILYHRTGGILQSNPDLMVPAMFPLLETVLELTFRDSLEYVCCIIFKRRFVIESLSFEWFFEFWNQLKVTGGYVGTVRMLSKQCDTVFTQKLLHKTWRMCWRVIVVKKPVTAQTRVIPKILSKISQTVVFGIPKSFSSPRTVNRRSGSIASRTRTILSNLFVVEGLPERESLSTEVQPPLKRLYHSFIRVLLIHSFPKAICIIWIVSELVFPSWKQNLMQIRWSCLSVITITKSAELRNSFVNKNTLRMNYTSGRCQQATYRFVRLYCWRSCPAEVATTLWRRDIKVGPILSGPTLYTPRTHDVTF